MAMSGFYQNTAAELAFLLYPCFIIATFGLLYTVLEKILFENAAKLLPLRYVIFLALSWALALLVAIHLGFAAFIISLF